MNHLNRVGEVDVRSLPPEPNGVWVELHVPDFEPAKTFYGKLGFEVVWERAPEGKKGYLVLCRGKNFLCFWGGNEQIWQHSYFKQFPQETKRGYAVEIVVMVEDIESLYKQAKTFVPVVSELEMRPWGRRDFRIEDPFGFYLRFTEPLNILDSAYALP